MSCVNVQYIDGDECIGASLPKINGNFAALSAAVCDLSGFNVVDSPTIDLNWNASTRTLSADVKDASVTNAKIAFDGGSFAFRNKIINGNFDIWQRGVTATASNNNSHTGFYSADRWGFSPNLAGTVTVSQSAFDITQTSVPNNPNNYLSYNCSVGSSGTPFLYQRIENVRLLAGKTVTLSFYAKSSAPLAVTVGYSQWYGLPAALGGTFSNQTNTSAGTINTTTSWAKYTITTTIPSIASGLTVDSAVNTFLQVYFGFPSSTTFKFDIAQVQLEEGPTATPFEHRPIGLEQYMCKRYYEYAGYYIDNNTGTSDGAWRLFYVYQAEKRIANPTLTWVAGVPPSTVAPGFVVGTNQYWAVVSVYIGAGLYEYGLNFTISAEL